MLLELLSLGFPPLAALSPVRLVTGEADLRRFELFPCLLRLLREPDEEEESESAELSVSESEDESLSLLLDEESELENLKPLAISGLVACCYTNETVFLRLDRFGFCFFSSARCFARSSSRCFNTLLARPSLGGKDRQNCDSGGNSGMHSLTCSGTHPALPPVPAGYPSTSVEYDWDAVDTPASWCIDTCSDLYHSISERQYSRRSAFGRFAR